MLAKPRHKFDVIVRPLVTEKAIAGSEGGNAYSFKVDPRTNKTEIKHAVEEIYEVKVKKVHTANMKGKRSWVLRRGRRYRITHSHWKKAVVTLQADYRIDVV